METDRIETEVLIAAPVERVWALITTAEHLGRWFGDAGAEIDLRPGGALAVHWQDHTLHGRVETVAPPHRFSYRWLHSDETERATPENSTLVEFALDAHGDLTRVAVVESGFDTLAIDAADRAARFAAHGIGWRAELGDLSEYELGSAADR